MSTGDVFLSVSSVAPEQLSSKRILSPLIEDAEDDTEVDEQLPDALPEFDFRNEEEKQIFMTETEHAQYIGSKETADNSSSCSGSEEQQRLNSDGEMFDEIYSDNGSSVESNDEDYETDLEVDEEKWLYPERFELDLTGEAKYVKVCEDMGISPTTYFIKHIQDRELKMKFHGLGPQRMKALAVPLQTNTNIEVLNLEGNAIDEDGAICLTKVLKENFFITELVLAENQLGTEGGKAISEMLINNRNLYKIDLTGNAIGDGAASLFCDVLMNNKLLKVLLLGSNNFEDEGARMFKTAMSDNTTLEELDLSWNHFKTRGAILLAEAIHENVGLKTFNMAMAGLGREGAEAMSKALRENRTLLELDISLNRINLEGAAAIAKGMRENDTLTVLKCGSNPFDSDGAMVILEAIDTNDVSPIKLLDFSNIMVKMNFAKLQLRVQEERGMKIINEGIIPEFARTNSARLTAFRVDPISAFKLYADNANVDLGAILAPLMDEEYSIDIKEFKALIKTTEIDVAEEQLNVIALRMCQNGRVYCRVLFDLDGDEDEELGIQNDDNDDDPPDSSRSQKKMDFSQLKTTNPGRNSIK